MCNKNAKRVITSSSTIPALYSVTKMSLLAATSSFSGQSGGGNSCWSLAERRCARPSGVWPGLEAGSGPIGGYYNSFSFAHWLGISSPQGQESVSGIVIGKSGLYFHMSAEPSLLPHK